MKKLILLASLVIGAIAVNAQTTPLTFKTSAGSSTGTIAGATTVTIYADVTATGSSTVTGAVVYAKTTCASCNIIPVVSNDGTNFSPIKSGMNYNSTAFTTTWFRTGYDTVMRGATSDSAATVFAYKFPTGYKFVGFSSIGSQAYTTGTFTAKGLAK